MRREQIMKRLTRQSERQRAHKNGIVTKTVIRARKGQGWYTQEQIFWTLSTEYPIWADEMRRIEVRRYHRRYRN